MGGGRINKHPPHIKTPVKGTTLASAVLGMAFAGVNCIMQNGLAGVQIGGRRDRISLFRKRVRTYCFSRIEFHV